MCKAHTYSTHGAKMTTLMHMNSCAPSPIVWNYQVVNNNYLNDLLLHLEIIALNVACNREVSIEARKRLNSITYCNGKLKNGPSFLCTSIPTSFD
jgi:hypothetical protein